MYLVPVGFHMYIASVRGSVTVLPEIVRSMLDMLYIPPVEDINLLDVYPDVEFRKYFSTVPWICHRL